MDDEVEFYIMGHCRDPERAPWVYCRAVDVTPTGISAAWDGFFADDCPKWDAVWCGIQRSYAALCSDREYGCHPISHRRVAS